MKILFLGLTITSSWGNGHATTYRSLCSALADRGHEITFLEKDVEWYRSNRDLPEPECCTLQLYAEFRDIASWLRREIRTADAIIIGSYFPDAIEASGLAFEYAKGPVFFYDIDTPITLEKLRTDGKTEYLLADHVQRYDAYLSFTGGPTLRELTDVFGAKRAYTLYCSVDPDAHRPRPVDSRYACELNYLGTYSSDRQSGLEDLLNLPARRLPESIFIVAGAQYPNDLVWPRNVRRIAHVAPSLHPAFYSSSRFTLNLTRQAMVKAGYSPSVRLFEAAACGAAILSDRWTGMDEFFAPGVEILLPADGNAVTEIIRHLSDNEIDRIGEAARARVLEHHTHSHRAIELEQIIGIARDHSKRKRFQVGSARPGAAVSLSV